MRLVRPLAAALAAILVVAACGTTNGQSSPEPSSVGSGGSPSVLPIVVSSEFGVGQNRALFAFLDSKSNAQLADPKRTLEVGFTGPNGQTIAPQKATFIWAIEGERAVYAVPVDFPAAGSWTAEFTTSAPGSAPERIQFGFDVKDKTSVLRPGDKAPSVDTPTAEQVGGDLAKVSTDTKPDPTFYTTSVAAALAGHKPFVLAFATPKFCATGQCGPTLDRLKSVAAAHPDVTFINVEPYQLQFTGGQLQPVLDANNQLQPVPAVRDYGLMSEPYIFVVDGNGVIKASFEAIFSEQEIDSALKSL